jgi:hypothetical protein
VTGPTGPTGTAPSTPVPLIQASTTTALTTANANTTYILASGATQNFTTAGLVLGDAGKVWYVKNASGGDIGIEDNGSAISGETSTVQAGTGSANSSIQIIYWNGANLIMY